MDNVVLAFLSVFINRVTEAVKRIFIDRLEWSDDAKGGLVLFLSLLLGVLGVVFLFPSMNLIAGKGASLLSEQIVTGIIIGGLANGVDFLGGVVDNLKSAIILRSVPPTG